MNLSPKERFLKSPDHKQIADLLARPQFHHALEVSLAELQLSTGRTDPAANWQRLEGAKQFISILLNLCDPPKKPSRVGLRDNLTTT